MKCMKKVFLGIPTTLVALLLLTSCSNVVVRSAHPFDIDEDDRATVNHGYVTARVVNNISTRFVNSKRALFGKAWTDIVVTAAEPTEDGKQRVFHVPKINAGGSSSIFFFGLLPPGEYAVSHLRQFIPSVNYISYAPAPATLGTFSIVPGRITDLGAMLYQPVGIADENIAFTITRANDGLDLFPQIQSSFPDIANNIARDRTFGWQQGSASVSSESNSRLLQVSLDHPIYSGGITELDDGRLLTLTNLGIILVRDQDGTLSRHDMGFRVALNDLIQLKQGGYLLAAEFGLLFYAQELYGPWTQVTAPGGAAANVQFFRTEKDDIYLLSRIGSQGKGIFFLEDPIVYGQQYQLHHCNTPPECQWVAVDLPENYDKQYGFQSDRAHLYVGANAKRAWRYSFASQEWSEFNLPLKRFSPLKEGAQISYSSNFNDNPKRLVIRSSDSDNWKTTNLYADGLPTVDNRGNWYAYGRRVVELAEGSRKTVPDLESLLFIREAGSDTFHEFGPEIKDCHNSVFNVRGITLSWIDDRLWGYCYLVDKLYSYHTDQKKWVEESFLPSNKDKQQPDA